MVHPIASRRGQSALHRVGATVRRCGVQTLGLAVWATVLCLLNGCATYYKPNSQNVPLFQERGEVRAVVGANKGGPSWGEAEGRDFQGAYAVTNHLGVMANMFFISDADDWSGDTGKGRLVECGVGYFSPLSGHWVFETYGGAGLGKLTRIGTFGRTSVSARRVFLQPSIGYASRGFDAALSLRMCGLTYSGIPEVPMDYEGEHMAQALRDARSSILVEPAFTIRAGWEYLKLQLQIGQSRNLTHPDFAQGDRYVSLGAYVTSKNSYKKANVQRLPETGR